MTEAVAAPPSGDTAVPPPADWVASLAPDIKGLIEQKGYKTPADVAHAYFHAQKMIGSDKILAPKDGVWDPSALEKLGVPKEVSEYQKALKRPALPEGVTYDEKFEQAALPVLHSMGIPPAAAQKLLDLYAGNVAQQHQALAGASKAAADEATAALKSEWGNAFDTKLTFASRAVVHIGGEELKQALDSTGAGNNPQLIKAFAKIGEMLGEDTLKIGKVEGGALAPAEAIAQANKLMLDPAYTDKRHPENAALVAKVQALFQMAYPEPRA